MSVVAEGNGTDLPERFPPTDDRAIEELSARAGWVRGQTWRLWTTIGAWGARGYRVE